MVSIYTMDDQSNILDQMNAMKEQYYKDNDKSWLFKKKQKLQCAETISNQFDIGAALQKTAFLVPNTNKIYMDYPVFKLFANPSNYAVIIQYLFSLYDLAIQRDGSYEIHVNLNSFTVSSIERYKELFQMFYDYSYSASTPYTSLIAQLYIYNTPSILEHAASMWKKIVAADVMKKMAILNRSESEARLEELFRK